MTRVVNFADGFTSGSEPLISGSALETYTLSNGVGLTNVTGLLFNSLFYKSVFMDFEIERVGTSTYRQTGSLIISYNGTWVMNFGNYQGDSILQDPIVDDYGITLSIDSASGQVKYVSGNQAGHVISKLKVYVTRITA